MEKPPQVEQHYRFSDLKRLRVVETWPTLMSWIRTRDFPPGKLISPRVRIWSASEIQDWLDKQSSEAA